MSHTSIKTQTFKKFADISIFNNGFPGEGNGTPLQYSCLENPMDGGAWWAAVSGVAQSWTRLKRLSSSSSSQHSDQIHINNFSLLRAIFPYDRPLGLGLC